MGAFSKVQQSRRQSCVPVHQIVSLVSSLSPNVLPVLKVLVPYLESVLCTRGTDAVDIYRGVVRVCPTAPEARVCAIEPNDDPMSVARQLVDHCTKMEGGVCLDDLFGGIVNALFGSSDSRASAAVPCVRSVRRSLPELEWAIASCIENPSSSLTVDMDAFAALGLAMQWPAAMKLVAGTENVTLTGSTVLGGTLPCNRRSSDDWSLMFSTLKGLAADSSSGLSSSSAVGMLSASCVLSKLSQLSVIQGEAPCSSAESDDYSKTIDSPKDYMEFALYHGLYPAALAFLDSYNQFVVQRRSGSGNSSCSVLELVRGLARYSITRGVFFPGLSDLPNFVLKPRIFEDSPLPGFFNMSFARVSGLLSDFTDVEASAADNQLGLDTWSLLMCHVVRILTDAKDQAARSLATVESNARVLPGAALRRDVSGDGLVSGSPSATGGRSNNQRGYSVWEEDLNKEAARFLTIVKRPYSIVRDSYVGNKHSAQYLKTMGLFQKTWRSLEKQQVHSAVAHAGTSPGAAKAAAIMARRWVHQQPEKIVKIIRRGSIFIEAEKAANKYLVAVHEV